MSIKKISGAMIAGIIFLAAMAAVSGDEQPSEQSNPEKSVLDRFAAEEQKKLLSGEAVYRHVKNEGPDGKMRGHGESYALINAPLKQCWNIFSEFDKHHLYFPRKIKSEVIEKKDNTALVYKLFDFYVTKVEYTILYTIDSEGHRVDFEMDKKHPHDIEDTAGYFLFEKVDEKSTLFTYAALKVETGLKVPGFIQEYITSRDLPEVAMSVKKRIESGGKWTKKD